MFCKKSENVQAPRPTIADLARDTDAKRGAYRRGEEAPSQPLFH